MNAVLAVNVETIGVVAAILLGLANLGWTWFTWKQSRRQDVENAERDRRVVDLQRKQTDALDRLAEVAQRREERATTPRPPQGARIGARLIHLGGADHRVTIRNAGPGPANIIDVLTLDHRAQVLEPTGLGTLRLMPGEEHSITVLMAFDVGYPLDVRLSWTDAIGSQHRDQSLMPVD